MALRIHPWILNYYQIHRSSLLHPTFPIEQTSEYIMYFILIHILCVLSILKTDQDRGVERQRENEKKKEN
jgi:hypothetical protein